MTCTPPKTFCVKNQEKIYRWGAWKMLRNGRGVYRVLVGKHEGNTTLARPRHKSWILK
jgi:hypothetical protein